MTVILARGTWRPVGGVVKEKPPAPVWVFGVNARFSFNLQTLRRRSIITKAERDFSMSRRRYGPNLLVSV